MAGVVALSVLAWVIVLPIAMTPQVADASDAPSFAKIADAGVDEGALLAFPNTRIEYYDVSGANSRAVAAALNALGPIDPADQARVHARTDWRISWRWPGAPGGGCDLSSVKVTFEGVVVMPRLKRDGPVSPRLDAAWARYISALRQHEVGHLSRAYGRVGDVAAAIRSGACASANARARQVLEDINREQVRYDAETRHGRTQGAVFR